MPKDEYTIGSHEDGTKKQDRPPGPPGPHGRGKGEKAKDFKGTIIKLLAYCKPYLPHIIISLIFALTGSILNLIGPNQLKKITNMIVEGLSTGIDIPSIISIGLILVILYILGYLFSLMQGILMSTVTQKISKSLRTDISTKINRLPLSYFHKHSYGDVLSRVINDVDTIGHTLNQSIISLIVAATSFIGSLIIMLSISITMTLSAIGSVIIAFALMFFIMGFSQKYFDKQQEALGRVNGHIEEVYAGHTVVKAYNGEADAKKIFQDINNQLYESAWKSQFLSGMMPILMGFVGNLGYVVVCVAGAVLVINGSIKFGVIVAFMLYIRMFTQPLSQLAQATSNLQSTVAAGERVFEFLDAKELTDESHKITKLENVKGKVSFENVNFAYTPDRTIINDVSFVANAGQKIAIVGPTGAGKTTLVNLLMRFYELKEGTIKVDDIPTSEMTREQVHSLFCMVLQDTWLFKGTIKENIVFNKKFVSDKEIVTACKTSGIHHYISTLPKGYDTIIDDNANLSAGQKQLLTIARAMVENSPILILDEATSSVDTRTELLIQEAMDKLMIGRTSFVIAHRLSTIKNADMILVMKDGDIVEKGSHNDLIAINGFYADLYKSQFVAVS